ncbi:MAG: cytochrome P450 [Solirubrobacterales bacterium]|nr:cytochrome P450 [Solirubrobacterales bacterium]
MASEKRRLRRGLPPGPRLPPALQLLAFWKRPAASLVRLRRRYGTRFTIQLPLQPPFVIISNPEEIKALFTASPEALHPGEGTRILERFLGRNSVILLDESAHLEQRRLLLPAFHGERMQRLTPLMTELAEAELRAWPREQPIELHPRLQRLTLEIILRAVFGLERGARLDRLRDLLTELLAFSESPLSVLPGLERYLSWLPVVRRFRTVIAEADAAVYALIDERRAARAGDRDDVLTMLLAARHEDGSPMSAPELRDELMTALLAGHETTASQLAWAFERLAREPAVAERLVREDDRYLTAAVHEILRLRPVLPNAEPRLTKRAVTIGGVTYPDGVALLASAFLVHHDPELYPEPYAFRPERFLAQPPGTYTWIPFGGGRRRCLGASFALQEMKIVLRGVLTRCSLSPAERTPEATARRSITFSPRFGARVVLHDRRPAATGSRDMVAIA